MKSLRLTQGLAGLAMAVCLPLALSATAADAPIATLTAGQVQVIRGTALRSAVPGFRFQAGDIVQTGTSKVVQIEYSDSYALGLGSNANLLLDRVEGAAAAPRAMRVVVLAGWLKAQPLGKGAAPVVSFDAPNLRARLAEGSLILRVEAGTTEVFSEASTPKITVIEEDGKAGREIDLGREQIAARSGFKELAVRLRPDKEFVGAIPVEMRDSLFPLASKLKGNEVQKAAAEPAAYARVEPWIDGNRHFHLNMVDRFRARIADGEFRSALDASLARHPEWHNILHPPPPPPPPQQQAQLPRGKDGAAPQATFVPEPWTPNSNTPNAPTAPPATNP